MKLLNLDFMILSKGNNYEINFGVVLFGNQSEQKEFFIINIFDGYNIIALTQQPPTPLQQILNQHLQEGD